MQSTSDSGWWLRGHGGLCCGVLHVNLKLVCVDVLAELCSVHQHRPTALLLGQPTTNHSPDSYTRTHRRTCPTHTHVTHKVSEHWACCSFLMHTHTHLFNGPFSGTTRVSRYQKGKTSLDFTVARDSEWQWHQLGHMQVCISLQADNHASTPPLSFLQTRSPSCRPTNSVKHWSFLMHISTLQVVQCPRVRWG